jgi:hypothetical protein
MSLFRRRKSTEGQPPAEPTVPNVSTRPVRNDPPATEEILDALQEPLPPGTLEWNRPTRCPKCEDWGYIDRLDLVARVMQLHCPTCHFHWEISEEQIEAAKRRRQHEDASPA